MSPWINVTKRKNNNQDPAWPKREESKDRSTTRHPSENCSKIKYHVALQLDKSYIWYYFQKRILNLWKQFIDSKRNSRILVLIVNNWSKLILFEYVTLWILFLYNSIFSVAFKTRVRSQSTNFLIKRELMCTTTISNST